MKKLVIVILMLVINIGVFSQVLPTITWRQGDLSKLNWGMSKVEVEKALGIKLKQWNDYRLATSYTTNYSGTWINNVRISFNCKSFTADLSFYDDKLYGIWFCTNANLKSLLTNILGEGVSNNTYPSDKNQREWWDNTTYLSADYEIGSVWIQKWGISDKAYNRDDNKNSFSRYLRLIKQ